MNSAHAVAIGSNGTPYVDQTIEVKDGYSRITSRAPSKSTTVDPEHVARCVFLNGTATFLPYSISCRTSSIEFDWRIIDAQLYKNGEIVSLKPFSNSLQNVDTFGFGNKKVFRFREVVKLDETNSLLAALASDVLSADKVQKYVDEAIHLKGVNLGPYQAQLKTDPAPVGCVGLVHFYWLSHTNQHLKYTSQEQVKHKIALSDAGKDLLVTYPIHPNAADNKIDATVTLLKERFEATLGRSFNPVHIPKIPLAIDEPDTIQSNFPTRDQIGL